MTELKYWHIDHTEDLHEIAQANGWTHVTRMCRQRMQTALGDA